VLSTVYFLLVSVHSFTASVRNEFYLYQPCYLPCPQIADGGKASRYWGGGTANIRNEQSRTVDKGWSFSLGIGELLKNPHCKYFSF
jgi:hypothetical protein